MILVFHKAKKENKQLFGSFGCVVVVFKKARNFVTKRRKSRGKQGQIGF